MFERPGLGLEEQDAVARRPIPKKRSRPVQVYEIDAIGSQDVGQLCQEAVGIECGIGPIGEVPV